MFHAFCCVFVKFHNKERLKVYAPNNTDRTHQAPANGNAGSSALVSNCVSEVIKILPGKGLGNT